MAVFERGRYPLFIRRFVTGMFQENTWFIRDEASGRTALIDPGDGVADQLTGSGLLGERGLDDILLTHAHLDHVWGLSAVKARWPGAPIRMHPDDTDLLRALPHQGRLVGMPIDLPPPPDADLFVVDSDEFDFGKRNVHVIHTPGHTRGGVCYLFDTGDCFLGDMIISGSVGRTDLPGGDPSAMKNSLKRLTQLDPETWIYGGHGPQSRLADEMVSNAVLPYLDNIDEL